MVLKNTTTRKTMTTICFAQTPLTNQRTRFTNRAEMLVNECGCLCHVYFDPLLSEVWDRLVAGDFWTGMRREQRMQLLKISGFVSKQVGNMLKTFPMQS